jgi:hypothetical protein
MGNWRSRHRDPAVTGIVRLPWSAKDPCPCGAKRLYGNCCGKLSLFSPYKEIVEFRPPGAPTGYSHRRCYMGWTRNCSDTISGEHFISESVLSILNPKSVRISGAAWTKGQTQNLPLKALQANILCTRHNSALSPLDTMAGKLFRAVNEIYGDLSRRTLSRKSMWHLFSGEELELWLLKTILGFFHANVLSQHGRKIAEVQKIMNRTIEKAYSTGHLPEPCGMYVQQNATTLVQRGVLDFMSLSDERGERVVGCGLTIVGIATTFYYGPGNEQSRTLYDRPLIPTGLSFRRARTTSPLDSLDLAATAVSTSGRVQNQLTFGPPHSHPRVRLPPVRRVERGRLRRARLMALLSAGS